MSNEIRKFEYDVQAGVYTANVFNTIRQAALLDQLDLLARSGSLALEQINLADQFIQDPSKILGSMQTKHGEISEHLTVRTINARDAVDNLITNASDLRADIDSVARTGATDYTIGNVNVQSKCCATLNESLSTSQSHNGTYANFTETDGIYHIPKDQHAELTDILAGNEVEGIGSRAASNIRQRVGEWADASQMTAEELVQSSEFTYAEVQLENAPNTIDRVRGDVKEHIEERKTQIEDEHTASWSEGATVVGSAAAIGFAIGSGLQVIKLSINGKNVFTGDYTMEDWKNIGKCGGVASLYAGGSAAVGYTLTNFTKLGPKSVTIITSTVAALVTAGHAYGTGKITTNELALTTSSMVASSAATAAIGVVLGSMIPIPYVGQVIGFGVAGGLVSMVKTLAGDDAEGRLKEAEEAEKRISEFKKIDRQIRFDRIQSTRNRAFAAYGSDDENVSMVAMGRLCLEAGVPDSDLVADEESLQNFLTEHRVYVGELVTD